MKHTWKITLTLVLLFFFSQVVGVTILNEYIDTAASTAEEKVFKPLFLGGQEIERPDIDPNLSFGVLFGAVLVGTLLALLLIKFKLWLVWKIWFFVAIWFTISLSFGAFFNSFIALGVGLLLTILKVMRRSVIIHNFTELFVYAGIAVIFVPIMNLFAAFALLFLISLYDAWAVWKNKHMITLANAQSKIGSFAGFSIPYNIPKKVKPRKGVKLIKVPMKVKSAVLGGGDIGFCLLFTGVILMEFGFWPAMVVPIFSSAALLLLLLNAKKDRFYPAMPFLTAGCVVGFFVSLLI